MNGRSQGQTANFAGSEAERTIEDISRARRINFARQYPVQQIYTTVGAADFMLWGVPGFPDGLIIESKWQTERGSVDEKYPYLIANIKETYPAPAIIVMDGDGARPEAIRWCRQQVDGKKLIDVMNLGQFLKWALKTL